MEFQLFIAKLSRLITSSSDGIMAKIFCLNISLLNLIAHANMNLTHTHTHTKMNGPEMLRPVWVCFYKEGVCRLWGGRLPAVCIVEVAAEIFLLCLFKSSR